MRKLTPNRSRKMDRVTKYRVLLLITTLYCAATKLTLPSGVKQVSLSARQTPCYSFMLNVSLSNTAKERKDSNTLRCYDGEGTRKRSPGRKVIRYALKFSDVKIPKLPGLLKHVELKMYIPFAVAMEIRHRVAGKPLSFTTFHRVTTSQLGWQTFDVTSLFKLATVQDPISFRVKIKLRNFTASLPQKEATIWGENKPMLFVATVENEPAWTNLMDSSVVRRIQTNRTESEPKRTTRSTSPPVCAKTPLSWRVSAADLGNALGLKMRLVSPALITLDYCSGDCTQSILVNTHSHLRAKFAKKPRLQLPPAVSLGTNPSQVLGLPSLCCVPVKFQALSILYLDENLKSVNKTLEDAVVTECGCR